MFVAIYSFKVKEGFDTEFKESWKGLTQLIYKYEGSLGSRLHMSADGEYIAYAQWPDQSTYEKAGDNLPDEAEKWRTMMRGTCESMETLHTLEMVDDLIKDSVSQEV